MIILYVVTLCAHKKNLYSGDWLYWNWLEEVVTLHLSLRVSRVSRRFPRMFSFTVVRALNGSLSDEPLPCMTGMLGHIISTWVGGDLNSCTAQREINGRTSRSWVGSTSQLCWLLFRAVMTITSANNDLLLSFLPTNT